MQCCYIHTCTYYYNNLGTNCTEYYQEAAPYGPSIDAARKADPGKGFNPQLCNLDYISNFTCPADPAIRPIYSEVKPPPATQKVIYSLRGQTILCGVVTPCYQQVLTTGCHNFAQQIVCALINIIITIIIIIVIIVIVIIVIIIIIIIIINRLQTALSLVFSFETKQVFLFINVFILFVTACHSSV